MLRTPPLIHVVADEEVPQALLAALAARFAKHPGPLQVRCHEDRQPLIPPVDLDGMVSWDGLFERCQAARVALGIPAPEVVVLLSSQHNQLHWFSAGHPSGRPDIFVHTGNWEWMTTAPLDGALAYEVVENVLELGLRLTFPELDLEEDLVHQPPIGCMNDLCLDKEDVRLKHRTADICELCLTRLEAAGASPQLLAQVLAVLDGVRVEALASARLRRHSEQLPYPVAVQRHKVQAARGHLHRLLSLLGYFDVLVRYAALVLSPEPLQVPARPSLGWWVSQLRSIDGLAAANAVRRTAEDARLVNIRNEWVGHGLPRVQIDQYRDVAQHVGAAVHQVETQLWAELVASRPVLLDGLALKEGGLQAEVRSLTGASPFWAMERIPLGTKLPRDLREIGCILLHRPGVEQLRSLHHAMRYDNCPLCQHERVLINDGAVWIDVVQGHRVELG